MKLKIKIRVKAGLTLTLFVLSVSTLLAEERTMPRFFLDYAVVDHKLKDDKGYSMELLKLYEKTPHSAIFIADFWHQKAFKECEESIQTNARRCSQKITLNMTEEEEDKIMEPAEKAANQCFYSFYYDNWDEINKTIVNKLKAAKINYRKNNYIYYLLLVITVILLMVFWRKRKILMPHKNT